MDTTPDDGNGCLAVLFVLALALAVKMLLPFIIGG